MQPHMMMPSSASSQSLRPFPAPVMPRIASESRLHVLAPPPPLSCGALPPTVMRPYPPTTAFIPPPPPTVSRFSTSPYPSYFASPTIAEPLHRPHLRSVSVPTSVRRRGEVVVSSKPPIPLLPTFTRPYAVPPTTYAQPPLMASTRLPLGLPPLSPSISHVPAPRILPFSTAFPPPPPTSTISYVAPMSPVARASIPAFPANSPPHPPPLTLSAPASEPCIPSVTHLSLAPSVNLRDSVSRVATSTIIPPMASAFIAPPSPSYFVSAEAARQTAVYGNTQIVYKPAIVTAPPSATNSVSMDAILAVRRAYPAVDHSLLYVGGRWPVPVSDAAINENWKERGFTCTEMRSPANGAWSAQGNFTHMLIAVTEGTLRVQFAMNDYQMQAGDELVVPSRADYACIAGESGCRWLYGYSNYFDSSDIKTAVADVAAAMAPAMAPQTTKPAEPVAPVTAAPISVPVVAPVVPVVAQPSYVDQEKQREEMRRKAEAIEFEQMKQIRIEKERMQQEMQTNVEMERLSSPKILDGSEKFTADRVLRDQVANDLAETVRMEKEEAERKEKHAAAVLEAKRLEQEQLQRMREAERLGFEQMEKVRLEKERMQEDLAQSVEMERKASPHPADGSEKFTADRILREQVANDLAETVRMEKESAERVRLEREKAAESERILKERAEKEKQAAVAQAVVTRAIVSATRAAEQSKIDSGRKPEGLLYIPSNRIKTEGMLYGSSNSLGVPCASTSTVSAPKTVGMMYGSSQFLGILPPAMSVSAPKTEGMLYGSASALGVMPPAAAAAPGSPKTDGMFYGSASTLGRFPVVKVTPKTAGMFYGSSAVLGKFDTTPKVEPKPTEREREAKRRQSEQLELSKMEQVRLEKERIQKDMEEAVEFERKLTPIEATADIALKEQIAKDLADNVQAEREAAQKAQKEKEQKDAAEAEYERLKKERLEKERQKQAQAEQERIEQEKARLEKARMDAAAEEYEKLKQERLEREKQKKEQQEKAWQEFLDKERQEKEEVELKRKESKKRLDEELKAKEKEKMEQRMRFFTLNVMDALPSVTYFNDKSETKSSKVQKFESGFSLQLENDICISSEVSEPLWWSADASTLETVLSAEDMPSLFSPATAKAGLYMLTRKIVFAVGDTKIDVVATATGTISYTEETVHEWKMKGVQYHVGKEKDWIGWVGMTNWKCELFHSKIAGKTDVLEVVPEANAVPSMAVLIAWQLATGPLRPESMAALRPVSPIALIPLSPPASASASPEKGSGAASDAATRSPSGPQFTKSMVAPGGLDGGGGKAGVISPVSSMSSSFGLRSATSAILPGKFGQAAGLSRAVGSFRRKPSSGFAMSIMQTASFQQTLAASQTYIEEKWNESYETGVWIVDLHHKLMFMIIRKLYDQLPFVSQEFLGEVLTESIAYARYHFRSEEELFDAYSIPGHKNEHRKFEDQMADFQKKHAAGTLSGEALGEYLQIWFTHHICMSDKACCVSLLRKWPDAGAPTSGEEQSLQAFRIVRAMREANATHSSNAGLSLPLAIISAVVAASDPAASSASTSSK